MFVSVTFEVFGERVGYHVLSVASADPNRGRFVILEELERDDNVAYGS